MATDKTKLRGEVSMKFCDMTSQEALKLQKKIQSATKPEEYNNLVGELHKRFLTREIKVGNICPIAGRAVIAHRLAGGTTWTGAIKYCAFGSDDTAANENDTILGTETYRKLVSSKTYDDNIVYVSTFFTATEFSGTIEEVGHFIDGTATPDSGGLISRLTSNESAELPANKSSTESLTVDYKLEINI